MEEREEQGFEVVDKRAKFDETPAEAAAEEQKAEEEPKAEEQPKAEAEAEQQIPEEALNVTVQGFLMWFVEMLIPSAWQHMGLQMNPITKKVEPDMVQAKLAIDTVAFMTDQLMPHVPEEQKKAYRALVSDLRVNFVQQSQKQ
jgi:hypothetical protein